MFDKVEYEYYVKPIGEDEIKMDYCFSGAIWEKSYCKLDNYKYYDVEYKVVEVNRIKDYYLYKYIPYLIPFLCLFVVFLIVTYIFNHMFYSSE